jgi:hypothetical protein
MDLWNTFHGTNNCWGTPIKVVGLSHGTGNSQSTTSYGAAAISAGFPIANYIDFPSVHSYANWGWPEWATGGSYGGNSQLAAEGDNECNMMPTKPKFGSEIGIQHDTGRSGDKWGTRKSQAAGYVQMAFGAWKNAWAGVTIYELGDRNQSGTASSGTPGNGFEDVWGLVDYMGLAYLSGVLWRWLGGLLSDSGSNKGTFNTGNLTISASGIPSGGGYAAFQASTGKVTIIVWDQQPLVGNSGGSYSGDLATPSASVTLTFGQTVGHATSYAFMAPAASYVGSAMSSCPTIPPVAGSITNGSSITFNLSSVAAVVIDP